MDSPLPREDLPHLDFVVTRTPSRLGVHVGGEVDLSNAAALHAKLTATDLDGRARLVLDLHRLTFCDSEGGHLLIAFLNKAHHAGLRTTIRGANPTIRRLLSLLAVGQLHTFE